MFNEALFNKVENISTEGLNKNQDKRALYERWQKAGDIVRFKTSLMPHPLQCLPGSCKRRTC